VARVLLFGRLGDIAGWREKAVAAETLDDLRRRLGTGDARLGEALRAPGVQAAVDRLIVRADMPLKLDSEVAFMPPMSGG
jgi:molybdopterin synthase sulfur carrier subunit